MSVNDLKTQHAGLPGYVWAQFVGRGDPATAFQASHGQSSAVITIDVKWGDLLDVLKQLLGYSFRDTMRVSPVASVTVTAGGAGYSAVTPPAVSFSAGGAYAPAVATARVVGGAVAGVDVGNGATVTAANGLYLVPPDVTFGGPGSGATAVAVMGAPQTVPSVSRIPPARHPYLTHYLCTRISHGQPLRMTGKSDGVASPGRAGLMATAVFDRVRLTCVFEPVDYAPLGDDELYRYYGADESQRYVSWKRVNTLSAINRKGQDFVWRSGPGRLPSPQPVAFGLLQQLPRGQLVARWRQVPEAALFPFGPQGPSPNLESAYGCVNAQPFFGYPAGVCLFDNWAPEPTESPYPLLDGDYRWPQRTWDVTLSFRTFDPPHPDPINRGWNLQPWSDGWWYYVSAASNPAVGLLPATDFSAIFRPN